MFTPNASITSWKHVAGRKGDGTPALGPELVPAPNRPLLGMIVEPTAHAIQSAAMRQVKLDLVLLVAPFMLKRFAIVPAIGDRLTVRLVKHGSASDVRVEIASDRSTPGAGLPGHADLVTLELKLAKDGV